MTTDFYYYPPCPPCRAVMMTARAIEYDLKFISVDVEKKENLKPSFLKLGPMHTVPTIVDTSGDDILIINESRAIMCYLITKYGKEKYEFLYPKKAESRVVVDQRLYFDCGTLYQRFADLYFPVLLSGEKSLNPDKKKKLEEAFGFFDKFLEKSLPWAAGITMTVADFSLAATVSSAVACGFDINIDNYFSVYKWLQLIKSSVKDYDKINNPGIEFFKEKAKKAKLIQ